MHNLHLPWRHGPTTVPQSTAQHRTPKLWSIALVGANYAGLLWPFRGAAQNRTGPHPVLSPPYAACTPLATKVDCRTSNPSSRKLPVIAGALRGGNNFPNRAPQAHMRRAGPREAPDFISPCPMPLWRPRRVRLGPWPGRPPYTPPDHGPSAAAAAAPGFTRLPDPGPARPYLPTGCRPLQRRCLGPLKITAPGQRPFGELESPRGNPALHGKCSLCPAVAPSNSTGGSPLLRLFNGKSR